MCVLNTVLNPKMYFILKELCEMDLLLPLL